MIASKPKYPGIRITTKGNQLVALYTEVHITEAGVFYPLTPSTEMGEFARAEGQLNVFDRSTISIECKGEHAAEGGIAQSVTGERTVNFTYDQGIVYGIEQYYHAPSKLSTMFLEVGATIPSSLSATRTMLTRYSCHWYRQRKISKRTSTISRKTVA